MDSRPIGVFDSGIGGLTVVKEIMKLLPDEDIIYFGDTARVPYGTKSKETVIKYSFQCIRFLLEKDVKSIVVACNTASATSLEILQRSFDFPIIGVVEPGAKTACKVTTGGKIGIIGTEGTVASGAYEKAVNNINNEITILLRACPLFVPIAEEGWQNTEVALLAARSYLQDFKNSGIDALIMACTHYPLLERTIENVLGKEIKLVNPAYETAKLLEYMVSYNGIKNDINREGEYKYFVSDNPVKFKKAGENFLERSVGWVEKIDIEKY